MQVSGDQLGGQVNRDAYLPYGLTVDHVIRAIQDFLEFVETINRALAERQIRPVEQLFMPATFSGIVSEFVAGRIPVYCTSLVKNRYPNGYPDLLPKRCYPSGEVQYGKVGIEVKASRRPGGWQGHNVERGWLMVVHFESATPQSDQYEPFRFLGVYAAKLKQQDWAFSGRSPTSRRTITASVNQSGMQKLRANWIFKRT